MASFMTMPSLAISLLLRIVSEEPRIATLADNVVLILLAHIKLSFWSNILLAVIAFTGLAYYETRAEYGNPEGNVREIPPGSSNGKPGFPSNADGIPVLHPSVSPNTSPEMCPINLKSFKLSRQTSNVPYSAASASKELLPQDLPGFCPETTDLSKLHGRPMLFPCHLRHRRITPFKDNFQHSYLYAGAPVGLHKTYSPLYSVDEPSKHSWSSGGWFNFRAQDHGIRGGAHLTLSQKLREFLVSENADPAEWAYAYLLGTPSINGTVDNPLGFWYLYTKDRELTAIVPELNTSYGERRMWLVRQALDRKDAAGTKRKSPYVFRGHFGKDIHVSPFMPLLGGYTIDTSDPCASPTNQLDILVTLTKPEGGPLLVTRVTSMGSGIDASVATPVEKASFLARWALIPSTGVMTFRILSQAARIYLKAPRFWTRPEPVKTALGKPARHVEMILERSFRLILKKAVENHPAPISVTYTTCGEHSHKSETFQSLLVSKSLAKNEMESPPTPDTPLRSQSPSEDEDDPLAVSLSVTLRVISPIFYHRFFHYQTAHLAFENELLDDERTRTLWSSDPTLFASIFSPQMRFPIEEVSDFPAGSSKYHWRVLSAIRRRPIHTNYPRNVPYKPFKGISDMDKWIINNCPPEHVREYRRALFRIFIGEWIGGATFGPLARFSDDLEPFGMSRDAVLRIYEAGLKAGIVAAAVESLRVVDADCNDWAIGIAGWLSSGLNCWAFFKSIC